MRGEFNPANGGRRAVVDSIEHHVTNILKQISERTRIHYSGPLPSQLQCAVNNLLDGQARVMCGAIEFRDAVVIELRAMCLVIETALSASTHAEKNARLRGATELIGATINRMRQESFDLAFSHWHLNGEFTRDHVTSQLFRENRDLKRRIDELERTQSGADE